MPIGGKTSFKEKLVRRRLKWAEDVKRMGDEKLAQSRCPDSGWKKEKKTDNAMGVLC